MSGKDEIETSGWVEFQFRGSLPALELFADFMIEQGAGGAVFSEDPEGGAGDQMVTAFLPLKKAGADVLAGIRARADMLKDRFPGNRSDLKVTQVEDRDWGEEWKKGLEPVRLPHGLWIVPSFKQVPEEAGNEPVIRLDPGLAFGTGLHPTTRMCVNAVGDAIKQGAQSILDIGTGTGILAMAASLFGAERILAMDLDPIALKVAEENLRVNGLLEKIELRQGISDPGAVLSGPPFDLVTANLFAEVLAGLMPFIVRHLAPSGKAVLSGILRERMNIVEKAVMETNLVITDRIEEEEWVTLVV